MCIQHGTRIKQQVIILQNLRLSYGIKKGNYSEPCKISAEDIVQKFKDRIPF